MFILYTLNTFEKNTSGCEVTPGDIMNDGRETERQTERKTGGYCMAYRHIIVSLFETHLTRKK